MCSIEIKIRRETHKINMTKMQCTFRGTHTHRHNNGHWAEFSSHFECFWFHWFVYLCIKHAIFALYASISRIQGVPVIRTIHSTLTLYVCVCATLAGLENLDIPSECTLMCTHCATRCASEFRKQIKIKIVCECECDEALLVNMAAIAAIAGVVRGPQRKRKLHKTISFAPNNFWYALAKGFCTTTRERQTERERARCLPSLVCIDTGIQTIQSIQACCSSNLWAPLKIAIN